MRYFPSEALSKQNIEAPIHFHATRPEWSAINNYCVLRCVYFRYSQENLSRFQSAPEFTYNCSLNNLSFVQKVCCEAEVADVRPK